MDYIFIDTGIFESNNFLESKSMQQLLKLAEEGEVAIVLPKITYNEVLARARVHIRAGIEQFNAAKKPMRVMRNIPSRLPLFDKIKAETVADEFIQVFNERLKQAKYIELDYPTVDVSGIFKAYFEGERPFGKGNKKHEFPDAFALATVEQWCKEHDRKCHVFSTDKDLLTYKNQHLIMVQDYQDYLTATQQYYAETTGSAKAATQYLAGRVPEIEASIVKWATGQLDDERRYTDVVNYLDVYSVDIKKIAVTLGEPTSVEVGSHTEVEFAAKVRFVVEVEIPDESTGWFDDEEREWHYFGNTVLDIDRKVLIPIKILVEVSAEDGHAKADGYGIMEINDGDDLDVEDDELYYKYYK